MMVTHLAEVTEHRLVDILLSDSGRQIIAANTVQPISPTHLPDKIPRKYGGQEGMQLARSSCGEN
jgi:hypothetical protein